MQNVRNEDCKIRLRIFIFFRSLKAGRIPVFQTSQSYSTLSRRTTLFRRKSKNNTRDAVRKTDQHFYLKWFNKAVSTKSFVMPDLYWKKLEPVKFWLSIVFFVRIISVAAQPVAIYVSPQGNDKDPGEMKTPVRSVKRALELSQLYSGKKVSIQMLAGTYYLSEPVVLTATEKAPSALEICAFENQKVFISAGRQLKTDWQKYKAGIYQTRIPEGISFERFYINGALQTLARYPDADENAGVFQGTAEDATYYVRVLTWGNPYGGYVHALDEEKEGSLHYKITGVDDTDNLELDGGWQSKKVRSMARNEHFVENIMGELDAPGEWYLDRSMHMLYYYPGKGVDLSKVNVEVSNLRNSFVLQGNELFKLKNVSLKNLNFIHNERTFMDSRDTLPGSDRAVYKGGAVRLENTDSCEIENCTFTGLGGNAMVFSGGNGNISVSGCLIADIGASGVLFMGNNNHGIIKNNLFRNLGVIEKQGVGVYLNKAGKMTITQNTFNNLPGPGIKAENCNMQEIKAEDNKEVDVYQEIKRPTAGIGSAD